MVPAPAALVLIVFAQWSHAVSGGFQVNPLGTAVRYDAARTLPAGFRISAFDNFQVYSNEFGTSVGWEMDPALIEAHVDFAVEPGFFIKAVPGQAPTGMDGIGAAGDRTFGWRGIIRPQINVNYKVDRIWLYSRTTLMLRMRDFLEEDTFQGIQIRHERFIEQATAFIFRFAGAPPPPSGRPVDPSHWVYLEYTVGGIDGFGTRPNRISAGVISEAWPWKVSTFNLDLFYSFAPEPIDGPGLILAYWLNF